MKLAEGFGWYIINYIKKLSTEVKVEAYPIFYKDNKIMWPCLSDIQNIRTRKEHKDKKLSEEYLELLCLELNKNDDDYQAVNQLSQVQVKKEEIKINIEKIPDDTDIRIIDKNFLFKEYLQRKRGREAENVMDEYLKDLKKKAKK